MPKDFIPSTDAGKLAWSSNYSTLVSAGPIPLGLTAGIATLLATKQALFASTMAAAIDPSTRGKATVFAKDAARKDLIAYCRLTARTISGNMNVTNATKLALGLTVPQAVIGPIPVPATAPDIDVVSVIGRTVKLRLHDAASATKRGKPRGVAGASIFSFVGAAAPTDASAWKFEGNVTRPTAEILFPDTVASGAPVWFTAFWYNPRAIKGPGCAVVGTNIQGGSAMAA